MRFGEWDGSSFIERMRFSTDGKLSIGTINPIPGTTLTAHAAAFTPLAISSETSSVWMSIYNNAGYKGYLGMYSGLDDIDVGTGSSNSTGKVHLVTQAVPKLTATAAGNVGIGDIDPTQKLEVNGKIKIGDDAAPDEEGSIRYNGVTKEFEGYNGLSWISLSGGGGATTLPTSTIVLSETETNTNLNTAGFDLQGIMRSQFRSAGAVGVWETIDELDPGGTVWGITGSTAEFIGNKLLIWGGNHNATTNQGESNEGYVFDTITMAWTDMLTPTLGSRANHMSGVTYDNRLIVYAGYDLGSPLIRYNDGGIYNPVTNSWTYMSLVNAPALENAYGGLKVCTGTDILMYDMYLGTEIVKVYNISTDTWSDITVTNGLTDDLFYQAIHAGGNRVFFYGGYNSATSTFLKDTRVLDLSTGVFTTMTQPPVEIVGVSTPDLLYLGNDKVLLYGGHYNDSGQVWLNQAAIFDIPTNTWTVISDVHKPNVRYAYSIATNQTHVYVWGGYEAFDGVYQQVKSGAAYNIATDTWTEMIVDPHTPSERSGAVAVWAGDRMIFWGGGANDASDDLGGGIYDFDTSVVGYGGISTLDYYLFRKN